MDNMEYDNKRAYDQQAKKVLSIKGILAYILKNTVDEFRDVSRQDIAEKCIEGTPVIGSALVDQGEALLDSSSRISGMSNEESNLGRVG